MSRFNDLFGFNRREKRGILVLTILLLFLIVANVASRYISINKKYDFSQFESDIDKFMQSQSSCDTTPEAELFYFDPNTASADDFMRLGISEKVAGSIVNYRNKGGKFRKPGDLAKIYGLSSELYLELEPYIIITETARDNKKTKQEIKYFVFDPNTVSEEELIQLGVRKYVASNIVKYRERGGVFRTKTDLLNIYGFDSLSYGALEKWIRIDTLPVVKKPAVMVELNSAGIDDLVSLKGIGKVYAERIIKYRERLGGYASVEQLKEVYGFNESLFNSVSNQVYADVSLLRCIQLNKADYKTMLSHPYLEKAEVEAILSYREMVDKIVSADELLKQKVLGRERYQQIKPYLCAD